MKKGSRLAGLVASAAFVGMSASSAFAADTLVQTILPGTRTASVADLTLQGVTHSNAAQTNSGTMTLTADDASATGLGWNVTIVSSAFVYSGSNGGSNIPASNLSLTSAAAPVRTAGQAVDAVGGPAVPLVSPVGTLDTARKTVQAVVGFGKGTYTQALGVSLAIPAQSQPGTYTGTLTTTISAAP
jgi:hypothetical protein